MQRKTSGRTVTMNRDYEQWRDQFVDRLQVRIGSDEKLKGRGNISVETFSHINRGSHEGVIMLGHTQSGISPVIYLDRLYESHLKGVPDEILMRGVVEQFAAHQNITVRVGALQDYEKMRDHLRIRVSGLEGNRNWAKEMVCVAEGDFIYSCYLSFRNSDGDHMTLNISKSHADEWKVPYEQVMSDARKHSREMNVELRSVTEVLGFTKDDRITEEYFSHPENLPEDEVMFILQELGSPVGASVIARDDVMQRVGEIFHDDYYVLPSSTMEVMLIPARKVDEPEKLHEMVKEINETMVAPEQRLSDHVQFYDRARGRMMNLKEYQRQKQELAWALNGKVMNRNRGVREDYER